MNWLPWIWPFIGIGVAIAVHIDLTARTSRWHGPTMYAGWALSMLFWPVVLVCLGTLALMTKADR